MGTGSENEIIQSDINRGYREEYRRLKEKLARIIARRDYLVNVEGPHLRGEYAAKFGQIELEVYEAFIEYEEWNRKVALARAAKNQNRRADCDSINRQAQSEFQTYRDDLNRKMNDYEETRNGDSGCEDDGWSSGAFDDDDDDRMDDSAKETDSDTGNNSGSESDRDDYDGEDQKHYTSKSDELKDLYRKLVKMLHPDVHPELGQRGLDLWNQVQEAYGKGDVEALRSIYASLKDGSSLEDEGQMSPEEETIWLMQEIEKLKKLIAEYQDEITMIKSEFPFTVKAMLHDPVQLEKELDELRVKKVFYEQEISKLKSQYEELTK